jgi:hypothetical protein
LDLGDPLHLHTETLHDLIHVGAQRGDFALVIGSGRPARPGRANLPAWSSPSLQLACSGSCATLAGHPFSSPGFIGKRA